jgi:hypothetical protein
MVLLHTNPLILLVSLPIEVKAIFTVAVGLLAVFGAFIERGDDGSTSARAWRGGENDALRRAILNRDGSLRPHFRLLAAMFGAVFLGVIWLVL